MPPNRQLDFMGLTTGSGVTATTLTKMFGTPRRDACAPSADSARHGSVLRLQFTYYKCDDQPLYVRVDRVKGRRLALHMDGQCNYSKGLVHETAATNA